MSLDFYGACPACHAPWHLPAPLRNLQDTTAAPAALAGTMWSDGYMGEPHPPPLVACPGCLAIAWIQDTVSTTPPPAPSMWARISRRHTTRSPVVPTPPGATEILDALEGGFARSRREERQLRLLVWWQHNHPQRMPSAAPPPAVATRGEGWEPNLRSLLRLLDPQQLGDALLYAEALRHLGSFEAALEALAPIQTEGARPLVETLRACCRSRSTALLELSR